MEWLLKEGLAPMFGPGVLFLVWCAVQWLANPTPTYALKYALDPMGWLYVAAGLAIPCAIDSYRHKIVTPMSIGVGAGGLFCILMVLACMVEKGKDPKWEPRRLMHLVSGIVALALLWVGYNVHAEVVALDELARAGLAGSGR